MAPSGTRTPPRGVQAQGRRLGAKSGAAEAAAGAALPCAVALFSLALTTLLLLWAQPLWVPFQADGAVRGRGEPGQPSEDAPSRALAGRGSAAEASAGAQETGGGGRELGRGPLGMGAALHVNPAPFLSDLLPERKGDNRTVRRLSPEERILANAEAVYRNNIIRRIEMTHGQRPEAPFRGWNAGRLREVFLSPTYPCPSMEFLGSKLQGKKLCFPSRLKVQKSILYSIGHVGDGSFEEALAGAYQTECHLFGPFLENAYVQHSRAKPFLHVHSIGIGANRQLAELRREDPDTKYITLPQAMAHLHHSHIHILKIDSDGYEQRLFPELAATHSRQQAPFSLVIVQIHQARHPGRTLAVIFALEDLGLRLYNVEPDPTSTHRYELSFVHEAFLLPSESAPHSL